MNGGEDEGSKEEWNIREKCGLVKWGRVFSEIDEDEIENGNEERKRSEKASE